MNSNDPVYLGTFQEGHPDGVSIRTDLLRWFAAEKHSSLTFRVLAHSMLRLSDDGSASFAPGELLGLAGEMAFGGKFSEAQVIAVVRHLTRIGVLYAGSNLTEIFVNTEFIAPYWPIDEEAA